MDLSHISNLVLRDVANATAPACEVGNGYDGRIGARISSIFVILIGSTFGASFPIYVRRRAKNNPYMEYAFFFAKYFGSGVIIATAFIHLLAPATDALSNPCLTGPITSYDWATAICLSMIFVLFFLELMTVRYASFGHSHSHDEPDLEHDGHRVDEKADSIAAPPTPTTPGTPVGPQDPDAICPQAAEGGGVCEHDEQSHALGADHLGHGRQHTAAEDDLAPTWSAPEQRLAKPKKPMTESYASQMTAIFILEFGIIFHSVFIGLTLAVAGDEFVPLYIVLCFHQTFEGLGLGTRLATAPWPASKSATPYWLALGFGLSTPTAIAVGLGIRHLYPPGSQTTLIVNGIFDSISAGILIYTGIVELMAHEFMFSPKMKAAPIKTVLAAYVQMCFGAGLMALLGKWA